MASLLRRNHFKISGNVSITTEYFHNGDYNEGRKDYYVVQKLEITSATHKSTIDLWDYKFNIESLQRLIFSLEEDIKYLENS